MSLYAEWVKLAYDNKGQSNKIFWNKYIPVEQKIYEDFLESGGKAIKGSVSELAERFNMPVTWVVGFIDGMKEAAFDLEYDIESVTEETEVVLAPPLDKLFKLMVEYKASHLYSLPQWDKIFSKEKQKEMYTEQKASKTVVKEAKPERNDPCPCGSGKKYKKCCGAAI